MPNATSGVLSLPGSGSAAALQEVLRAGAQRMLIAALEAEVKTFIDGLADQRAVDGHRLVVRNGHHRTRRVDTGIGPIEALCANVRETHPR